MERQGRGDLSADLGLASQKACEARGAARRSGRRLAIPPTDHPRHRAKFRHSLNGLDVSVAV